MAANSGALVSGNVVSVTNTKAVFVPAADYPRRIYIKNTHATDLFEIGGEALLTAANGFTIADTDTVVIDLPPQGEIWAIVSATAVNARWLGVEVGGHF